MDKESNPHWERLSCVIAHSGEKSINTFARSIGLKRSENLYRIKRGNNGISRRLADRISDRYPEIDKQWLQSGKGSMIFRKDNELILNIRMVVRIDG